MDSTVFSQYLADRGRAAKTVQGYVRDLGAFSRWFEGTNGEQLRADNLTPTDVREYRQWLQVVIGARPATVNRRLSALRAFGAACCDLGLAEFNPAARVRWVREQANGPRWLSKTDQMRMQRELELALVGARTEAAKIQALRDQAAALLMLLAGLRVGEVCALEVDDLDLSERRGSVRVRCGKGGKERIVPLNKTARQALQAWLEARPEGGQAVFVGKRGEAMTPSGIQRRIGQLGRRAGVEATPHILRHTFAKRLVDAGISLEKVASLLGHENLNTTRIYVEPSQADLRRAVEALDL